MDSNAPAPSASPPPGPLVEAGWLASRLGDPGLRIIDATVQVRLWPFPRAVSGRRQFRRGHIPGAAFADLLKISARDRPAHSFTMPPPAHFAAHMAQLGIGDDTRVVIYDSRENMWAARLWWMLRAFGFDNAAVLDGGWTAWKLEGLPVESGKGEAPEPASFTPRPRPELLASKADVLAAIDDDATALVSALGRRQHRGERNEYGRRGHIPGAHNVTAWEILDRDSQRYRPIDELRRLFQPLMEYPHVIAYCGGGVAACSDALVLQLLGHPDVAVYDGGLMEWCADDKLPLEIGD